MGLASRRMMSLLAVGLIITTLMLLRMFGPPAYRTNFSVLVKKEDGTITPRPYNWCHIRHQAAIVEQTTEEAKEAASSGYTGALLNSASAEVSGYNLTVNGMIRSHQLLYLEFELQKPKKFAAELADFSFPLEVQVCSLLGRNQCSSPLTIMPGGSPWHGFRKDNKDPS
jgi:hypothetical protein